MGIKVDIRNSKELKNFGTLIKQAINNQMSVCHPTKDFINKLEIVTFYSEPTLPEANYKNVHIFSDAQADRSPGGTGTTAWVSRLVGRGELALGEEFVIEGFVGGTFKGKAIEKVKVGDLDGVIVEVTGSAHIMGFQQIIIDPKDPLKHGFIID